MVEDVFYSRRNFLEPELQKSMHSSFDHEVAYLDRRIENGAPYIMGRYNKDCECQDQKRSSNIDSKINDF